MLDPLRWVRWTFREGCVWVKKKHQKREKRVEGEKEEEEKVVICNRFILSQFPVVFANFDAVFHALVAFLAC